MGAPGKSVVIEGGKRGVLLSGKSAVYCAEETCPACCIGLAEVVVTDQVPRRRQGGLPRQRPDDVRQPWTSRPGTAARLERLQLPIP